MSHTHTHTHTHTHKHTHRTEEEEEQEEENQRGPGGLRASSKVVISENDKYLVPWETEAQIQLLWRFNAPILDFIWGRALAGSTGTKLPRLRPEDVNDPSVNDGWKLFFSRVVLVPPNRFRPASKLGDATSEHPQVRGTFMTNTLLFIDFFLFFFSCVFGSSCLFCFISCDDVLSHTHNTLTHIRTHIKHTPYHTQNVHLARVIEGNEKIKRIQIESSMSSSSSTGEAGEDVPIDPVTTTGEKVSYSMFVFFCLTISFSFYAFVHLGRLNRCLLSL
jgi:hypothetical protein